MRKMLVLTTLLFGLLLAGCSEDSNNNGSQAGNGGSAGFEGNNPALAITVQYAGGLEVNFSATLFDQKLGENYSFLWDFGDNSTSGQNSQTTLANPKYKYAKAGKYNVRVSVTDSVGTPVGYATALITVSDSGIITETALEHIKDESDLLTYHFTTKAYSTSGIQLTYTWDFKDGSSPEVGPNRMSHTFSKYGTEYTPEVLIEDKASDKKVTERKTIKTPMPGLDIECSVSGLVVTCTPQVTGVEGSLDNAVYTWKFSEQGDSSSVEETTRNNDPVVYTFNSPGQKNITVTGTSSQVTGTLTASSSVNLSNQISLGAIECRATGELLQYTCSVDGQVINNGVGELTYAWKFNNMLVSEYTGNEATYTFSTFPSENNPSYPVSVTAELGQSEETATQNARITIQRPTVSIQKGSDNATAGTMSFVALLNPYVDGASYTWTISGPQNFTRTITGSNKTSTDEIKMPYEGTYTANLKVEHTSFGAINASPFQAAMSASVEGAVINCTKVDGMKYNCSTNAKGYATVDGKRQEVPLTYQWSIARGDGNENYENTERSFTQQLRKYDGTYRVNLVLIPQGTDKAVRAPQVEFKTDKPTLTLNKTAATVGIGGSITFTPVVNNKLNNIELSSPVYTWTLDGNVQGEKTPSYTRTFQGQGQHTIKVDITAENLGSPLSAQTTIEALATAIKPEDINNVTVDCQHTDRNNNDIKKLCTVGISYRPGLTGVDTSTVRIHLIPRGVRGNADSPAVVFGGTAPQQQAVIFDWPFLNIGLLENKSQRKTFDAYLGIEVYANNKKIKTFNDVKYTIQYPIVSYELRHYANTANNVVGTGATVGLKTTAAPFNGQADWEWHMYFKGYGGTATKTFTMDPGGQVDLSAQMKKARFAGTVKGNPFNLQSGFGVKISAKSGASILSKPLYLYGVNTIQGEKDDPTNALGAFLDGSSWMSPQGKMYWEGQEYRDRNHHGYVLNFALYLDDREYVTDGWKQFCLIGSLGYGRDGHFWALPEAKVLSTHPTLKGRYSAVVGFAGSLQEKRSKTPQGGQPALPKGALNNELWWKVKGEWFGLPDYGFRGAQIGYMTTLGNMETCKEVKTFKFEKTNSAVYNPWNGQ